MILVGAAMAAMGLYWGSLIAAIGRRGHKSGSHL